MATLAGSQITGSRYVQSHKNIQRNELSAVGAGVQWGFWGRNQAPGKRAPNPLPRQLGWQHSGDVEPSDYQERRKIRAAIEVLEPIEKEVEGPDGRRRGRL